MLTYADYADVCVAIKKIPILLLAAITVAFCGAFMYVDSVRNWVMGWGMCLCLCLVPVPVPVSVCRYTQRNRETKNTKHQSYSLIDVLTRGTTHTIKTHTLF